LCGLSTLLATMNRTNRGEMTVRLERADPSQLVFEQTFDMAGVADNRWQRFLFPPVPDSAGKRFTLTFAATRGGPGNALTVWFSPKDRYRDGEYAANGVSGGGDLTLKLYYGCPATETR